MSRLGVMMPEKVVYRPGENRPWEIQRRSSYDGMWDTWSRHRWLWVAKLRAWELQHMIGKATRVVEHEVGGQS